MNVETYQVILAAISIVGMFTTLFAFIWRWNANINNSFSDLKDFISETFQRKLDCERIHADEKHLLQVHDKLIDKAISDLSYMKGLSNGHRP